VQQAIAREERPRRAPACAVGIGIGLAAHKGCVALRTMVHRGYSAAVRVAGSDRHAYRAKRGGGRLPAALDASCDAIATGRKFFKSSTAKTIGIPCKIALIHFQDQT
jgi:hypothetical protein